MPSESTLVEVLPRGIACVHVTTVLSQWPSEFMHSLNKVYAAIDAGRIRKRGHNVMVYRPRDDGSTDIECGVEVAGPFEPIGDVVYSETPSGLAVTMTHVGPYDQLGTSYEALARWSRDAGYNLSEICWEIYGDWDNDPARLCTDVFRLVK
jgi:effector-binding domain-containing protein